ncbi:MAG TPA: PAS domain-containing sensor histidine kinase [Hymenobacter sp.]|uniref:PAS domain-containing sensor histidine kinase n=1 Tax=Hymenobacter sp. TaxID=1898978 RepID=UPI002D7F1A9B|nr:PAS domain-containing sensor histidine kinase [Hymenobacter sp.]HET9502891.1 PAS domain-containing sensor histidine kinase [Hymenobacter sp.]
MNESAPLTAAELARENEELRHQLREAEELIAAVRTGAIDALAIQGADGPRIFTLEGADHGYRTLIEEMNEGALLLSPEGTVLYSNGALAELLRCPLEEVLGSDAVSFVPAAFQAYWTDLVARGWEGRVRGELPLQTRRGLLRPFTVSMNALTFDGAQALAVLVTDVSAEQEIQTIRAAVVKQNALLDRTSEELVRQQAARLAVEQAAAEVSRVLEGIPQIAWTADPDGTITYFNRRWLDYVGEEYASAEQLASHMHPDDFEAGIPQWLHSLATGQALDVELRIRAASGDYRWMLVRALPSRNEQGEIVQWIGTYTDIHEQKEALERIDLAQNLLLGNFEELTRVNIDLDNFIYTASHDLKAPITNIEGLVQALVSELPAEAAPQSQVALILRLMQDSVERFKHTIEQLTDVSKLQREHGAAIERVPLAAVVEAVRLDLEPLIQSLNAEVTIDVAECPPLPLSEKNLRSVVYNLLSNALKYHAPERRPQVRLRARCAGQHLLLAVQDNGLGLDRAGRQKLFGMFQRLHDHVEGSGIGLYMVKRMVENAGGRIEVKSQLGVGSTFSVYLPQ